MPSFEDSLLAVDLRLKPQHAIHHLAFEHLCGQSPSIVGFQLHSHADGLKYWIFWNPFIPEVAETDETFREVHGLILLVSGPDWPDKLNQFNTDLLAGTLSHNVVLPFEEKWKYVRRMLKRLELERNGRRFPKFLFAVILPEKAKVLNERKRATLAHDFSMAGTTFLAAQLEWRLNGPCLQGADEIAIRPHEFILLEFSSTQIRMTFAEEFLAIRDRIIATWICKQMSRRGSTENQAGRPRWWMTYSFEAPPKARKMKVLKGVFVTWTVQRAHLNQEAFNILLCFLAVSFRPFLKRAVSQLKCFQNRDLVKRVESLYRI